VLLLRGEAAPVGLPSGEPTVQRRDISTRAADPVPLTIEDVFPEPQLEVPGWPPYVMIGSPQEGERCDSVGSSEVERLLARTDCTQFIRASFAAPGNVYFVTGGLLNLADTASAEALLDEINALIQGGLGRLSGFVSDPAVNRALFAATARITMRVHGHFLLYAVVVRQDEATIAPDEQGEQVVSDDMVRYYLRDTILVGSWSLAQPTDPSATGTATATTASSPTG
jgi:hypothetical protein